MRRLLLCGFFIVGLPNLIGFAFGGCVRVALLYARPFGDAKVRAACGDVAGGFATVFAAAILAHIFNIPLGQWVPVVAAIWFAIHFALLRRAHELVRASMGVFCGWLAYSILLN